MQFSMPAKVAFGLAFDVERTDETRSGFKPAQYAHGAREELFGDIRIAGFAALLNLGFAQDLVIVGGKERREEREISPVDRAWAIKKMLVEDEIIAEVGRVSMITSRGNTEGNVAAIKTFFQQNRLDYEECFIVSSYFHLERIRWDLKAAALPIDVYPAEVFLLLENKDNADDISLQFGRAPLTRRVIKELQGLADKIAGRYKSQG